MAICPHCGANTIGPFSKFWSDAACPVRCADCGGLAYLESKETSVLNALVFPGSLVAFFAVAFTNSLIPFIVFVILLIVAVGQVILRSPMLPVSAAEAVSNKRWGAVVLLLVSLGILVWWYFRA